MSRLVYACAVIACAVGSVFGFADAQAAVTAPQAEQVYRALAPERALVDAGPLGERVNLEQGTLSFLQTDASLSGTGPLLAVSREFITGNASADQAPDGAFADWDLALPRLTTLSPAESAATPWQIDGGAPGARCTQFGLPSPIAGATDASSAWWRGYQLIVPGDGAQELLKQPANSSLPQPAMVDGNGQAVAFPLATRKHWRFACLPATANGAPGEAFLGIAPNGTKYWFNWMVTRQAPSLALSASETVARVRASLLPTRIEDRFGNALVYTYSGELLTGIQSSDGRSVSLQYVTGQPLVAKVILQPTSAAPRVWTYQYSGIGTPSVFLSSVTRPDGSAWIFHLQPLATAALSYGDAVVCGDNALPANDGANFVGSILSPTGLTGSFTVMPVRHIRSGQAACTAEQGAIEPSQYDTLSLTTKAFTGAGLPGYTWTYNYVSDGVEQRTDIGNPDGTVNRFVFSNVIGSNLDGLLTSATQNVGGTPSKSAAYTYVSGALVGVPASQTGSTAWSSQAPLQSVATTLSGDSATYTWSALAFDSLGNPTDIRRGNTLAGQVPLEVSQAYLNDTQHWVLGQPTSTTNAADQAVISNRTYDAATGALASTQYFGLTSATYTTDAQGQVTAVTDGNSHTTQFKDYKLGVPQTIVRADGTTVRQTVDDFGEVTSTTDATGATSTTAYDALGRVITSTYPTGDDVVWNPVQTTYAYVSGAEAGMLAGGHWRQTVARGSAVTVTYLDALMRPVLQQVSDTNNSAAAVSRRTDYDWRGLVVFTSNPMAGLLTLPQANVGVTADYDALGRIVARHQDSELGTLTTSYGYLSGARVQVTDPKGKATTTTYQVFDSPNGGEPLSVVAPENVVQTISRNVYGQPLSVTQSGSWSGGQATAQRQYFYDANQRLCRTVDPEAGSTLLGYDGAGNVTWTAQGVAGVTSGCGSVSAAQRNTKTFDALNRLVQVSYPDTNGNVAFTYDAADRPLTAQTGQTLWKYTYDKRGLAKSETLQVEGFTFSLGYSYDANGSLASTTYPDGRTISHGPDAFGRPTKAVSGSTSYASGAAYLPSGALASFRYGNGLTYLAEANIRGGVKNLTYGKDDGTLLYSQDLGYDANANLVAITDLTNGSKRNRSFTYDGLNRLVNATALSLWQPINYVYDPLDNLRSVTSTSSSANFQYDASNRLSKITDPSGSTIRTYGYDARGNVASLNTTAFQFDLANQLTQVTGKEAYVYDAFGRRVVKTHLGTGGSKTYYVYSSSGQLMHQRDNLASTYFRDFAYLGRTPVAQLDRLQIDLPGAISFDSTAAYGYYTVAWGAAPDAIRYELQERPGTSGTWALVYQGTATSYRVTGKQGGAYYYRVRVCQAAGCGGWVLSSPVGVAPVLVTNTYSPTGIQKGPYTLSWGAVAGATDYTVQEMIGSGAWTTVAAHNTTTSITRPGSVSAIYNYRLSANNQYGNRGWKSMEPVTVDLTIHGPPASPTWVNPKGTLTLNKGAALTVSWAASQRTTYYQWQIGAFPIHNAGTATSGSTTQYVGGDANDIRARACNADGCSGWTQGTLLILISSSSGGGNPL